MKKAIFITLYIDWKSAEVEVHIQRLHGTNIYKLKKDMPSVARLWNIIKDCHYVSYPAQQGWGMTDSNGRARRIYKVLADRKSQ